MPFRSLILILAICLSPSPLLAQDVPPFANPGTVPFTQSVLVSGLQGPWEITWGPDSMLWVTERTAGRIDRINPKSGQVNPAITFTDMVTKSGQDGLLGMALDPGLGKGTGHDFVYTAYTHLDPARRADPAMKDPASPHLHMYAKIIRLRYDAGSGILSDPVILIDGLPAGADHDSGRMKIGPDGKLYYTIGDRGNDQLANWCIPIEAQRLPTAAEMAAKDYFSYQGKSLRMNLDGTIPADNPVLNGVQSHVFTYGHRNMQGISFGPDGTLYASEHGPKTDDEINILKSGGNYGWPHVAGFRDNKAYQYARWADASKPCASLHFSDLTIDPSVPTENETDWNEPFIPPIATLFTVPSDWNFSDPKCGDIQFICWPTVAPSSILAYRPAKGGIPGFDNSLLVTTLKRGSLYRLPLSADGQTISGPIERYFQTENRYRDIEIGPDGRTFYIATDPGGLHETLSGGVSDKVVNPGAILVFTYNGK
ncbi:MAG: PQQ-dependent sugar dehydrogenase [Pseudomonadota bacterium]|nr:PQQ-dependent sugar dehydrogenase [Pseudomonadota bacterium]